MIARIAATVAILGAVAGFVALRDASLRRDGADQERARIVSEQNRDVVETVKLKSKIEERINHGDQAYHDCIVDHRRDPRDCVHPGPFPGPR